MTTRAHFLSRLISSTSCVGRKTFHVEVESEVPEEERVERQSCDLFDYRVYYEWSTANPKRPPPDARLNFGESARARNRLWSNGLKPCVSC